MGNWIRYLLTCLGLMVSCSLSHAQMAGETKIFKNFWSPPDTLNKKRFNLALTSSSLIYTGFSIGLYNTWYRQYPQTGFHFFNDWNEWNKIDKVGHLYGSYFQAAITYKGARWTGLKEDDSILVGAICGTLFQSTIEVMDGFSEKWGFSVTDMAANVAGISAFVVQQKVWGEQKITLKVSSYPKQYSTDQILSTSGLTMSSLDQRASELFGNGYAELFLKDYNAQTIWASFNIKSFMNKDSSLPDWLNVAVGYGSENMFGGFENEWQVDGERYIADKALYPRYKQYYLGLDIDLTRIKVKSPFLKSMLYILNIFKLPLPAVEYNSLGNLKFHALSK